MLRLWVRVASALVTVAVAMSPAGTAERVHRTNPGSVGSIGAFNP